MACPSLPVTALSHRNRSISGGGLVQKGPHANPDMADCVNSSPPLIRSLGNGIRKNGACNQCPYRRCGVDTEIPYRPPFWREFCLFLPVRVAPGVDAEFPYRVRIVDRGVDYRDPVCRHRFRFLD